MVEVYRSLAHAVSGLGWAGTVALALALTAASTALGVVFLILIPADHFTLRPRRQSFWFRHPVVRVFTLGLKNLLGIFIAVVGLIMLVTPGPGFVFTLLGVSLLDIPGKRRVEKHIISRPRVLSVINDLRRMFKKPPIIVDHD